MNKLAGIPPIHYISIEESTERRNKFHEKFKGHEIIPHVYKRFKEYNYNVFGYYSQYIHEDGKGAITSHLNTLKNWLETTDEEYCFVAEDDLSIETVSYWSFTWEDFFIRLPSDWSAIQLCWIREKPIKPIFRKRTDTDWGACAYLMKREYVQKLIDTHVIGDTYRLEIPDKDLLPIIENILFAADDKVYNYPLFVEDINNLKSTCVYITESNQGEYHCESHNYLISWWKNKGKLLSINKILTMEHIYGQEQFGENWFSYPNLYKSCVEKFSSGSKFVEVGSWKGKSSAYMAVEIANSGKDIEFTCIDTWEGSIEHASNEDINHLYDTFITNMKPVEKYYTPIKLPSLEAVKQFEDNSLDFVFIDASHEYEDVKQDIIAWLPKVKPGGIIAGHDYYVDGSDYFPGVKQAVNECLTNFSTLENCWIYNIESNTNSELYEFAMDPENAQKNFNLGVWYKKQNHLAPALTYFLRASERTDDINLAYESLINGFFCYDQQGHREISAQSMIHQALLVNPKRPEVYYILSTYYSYREDWLRSYLFADLGVQLCEDNLSPLQTDVGYPGKFGLLFQKVISGWWWGKADECRNILQDLIANYWHQMPEYFQNAVENNYSRLGSTKDSQASIRYNKSFHDKLRTEFKHSLEIEKNYSQVYQDMFVLMMLNGKTNGTFLEVGGADPIDNNNTHLLESEFGWSGVSIELNEECVKKYSSTRMDTKVILGDATKLNYSKILNDNFNEEVIDYLQLDIEPAKNTFEALLAIPFDKYKFAVITYEHDYYVDVTKSYREKSRRYLQSLGYELVVNDISPDGVSAFEDWWVHPDLIDRSIVDQMKAVDESIKNISEYMLNK